MRNAMRYRLLLLAGWFVVIAAIQVNAAWNEVCITDVSDSYSFKLPSPIPMREEGAAMTYELLVKMDLKNEPSQYGNTLDLLYTLPAPDDRPDSGPMIEAFGWNTDDYDQNRWQWQVACGGISGGTLSRMVGGAYYHITMVLEQKKNPDGTIILNKTIYQDGYKESGPDPFGLFDPIVMLYDATDIVFGGGETIDDIFIKEHCAGFRIWNRALGGEEVKAFTKKLISPLQDGLIFQSGWGVDQVDEQQWLNVGGDGLSISLDNANLVRGSVYTGAVGVLEQVSQDGLWDTAWLNNGQLASWLCNKSLPEEDNNTYELLFSVPEVVAVPQYILGLHDVAAPKEQCLQVVVTNRNVGSQTYQLVITETAGGRVAGSHTIDRTFAAGDVHQLTLVHDDSQDGVAIYYAIDAGARTYAYTRQRNSTNEWVYLGYDPTYPQHGAAPLMVHGFRAWNYALSETGIKSVYRRLLPLDTEGLLCQCGWGVPQTFNFSYWHDWINYFNFEAGGMQAISTISTNVGVIGQSPKLSFQGQLLEDDKVPAAAIKRTGVAVFGDVDGNIIWKSKPQPLNIASNGYFNFLIDAGQTNPLEDAVLSTTNELFLSFEVKNAADSDAPYEAVYPPQPLLSVPYALKADYMAGADDLNVLGGGVVVQGDATFDYVELDNVYQENITLALLKITSLCAEELDFIESGGVFFSPVVFDVFETAG